MGGGYAIEGERDPDRIPKGICCCCSLYLKHRELSVRRDDADVCVCVYGKVSAEEEKGEGGSLHLLIRGGSCCRRRRNN